MKSTDFRIGNIVGMKYYNPHPSEPSFQIEHAIVCQIRESLIYVMLKDKQIYKLKIDEIQPIKITENYIQKYGFIHHEVNGFSGFFINGRLMILSEKGEYEISIYDKITKDSKFLTSYIEYVHQLQNLFYAITGNELEIKPLKQ